MAETQVTFNDADAYERYMGRWSRAVGEKFLAWLAPPKNARWLDLGCGNTSDTIVGVEIPQIDARYVQPGQPVELTFKFVPGTIYSGKVETVLQAIASGQTQASGTAVTPKTVQAAPFVVRVKLDDAEVAKRLPAGSAGDAAIFTEHVKATHVIRKVLLRQIAITNYVNPF